MIKRYDQDGDRLNDMAEAPDGDYMYAKDVLPLIAAGDRVVAAFRKLGETSSAAQVLVLRQECEASMLALDEVLAKAKVGGS